MGSSVKQVFILAHDQARQLALEAVRDAREGMAVTISEPTRTLDQNAAQWPYLAGFAAQKQAASAAPAVSGLGVRVKRDGRVVKKRPGLGEGDSRKRRAVAVKKVMSEHPELSLGQASKFVKENGIKY